MDLYYRELHNQRIVIGNSHNLDFPPHIHEDLELVYMLGGSCTAYCADAKYQLKQGDFFLTFPNQVHHYYESRDCDAVLIIINPAFLSGYSSVFDQKAPVCSVFSGHDEDLRTLLLLTVREYTEHTDRDVSILMLTSVIGKLLRHFEFRSDLGKEGIVAQLVKYRSAHYKEPISIESVSKSLYLSPSHISHTFNDKLKISFPDYINSLRLDDAIHLLEHGDRTMDQIAELSGFPTVRTFNRAFQKRYGMSPSQYKKSSL